MSHFILVHGAWHGAWCWDELVGELKYLGHETSVLDLPGSGSDVVEPGAVTLDACAERVADVVRSVPGKSWLVGHSMGGIAIAQTAEIVPERIEGLVYVTAVLPTNGQTMNDALYGSEPQAPIESQDTQQTIIIDEATGCAMVAPGTARAAFYNLCSDAQVDNAMAKVNKWQALGPAVTPLRISPERGGGVPRFYVECVHDRTITIEMQRRMLSAAGVTGTVTLDADHSPFWSRPADLARALHSFATSRS